MPELNFKLVERRRGDPVFEDQVIDYCTREDGQLALEGVAEATHGQRFRNSVHYVGRDGENWITELKKVRE